MNRMRLRPFALIIIALFTVGLLLAGVSARRGGGGGGGGRGGGGGYRGGGGGRVSAGRPSYRPSAPSHRPSTPSYRPTTPSHRPSTPSYRPSTPSHRPSTPSYKPTTPSQRPVTPSRPSQRPATPAVRPSVPGRPGQVPGRPSTLPSKPGATRPGTRPGAPGRPGHPSQHPIIRPGGPGRGPGYDRDAYRHYHHPIHEHGHYYYHGYRALGAFTFGYWAFNNDVCGYPYCYSSPFYGYGLPYVYGPTVVVNTAPQYTYSAPAPDYSYTGAGSAFNAISSSWANSSIATVTSYIDVNQPIDVYLDGKYMYTVKGSDYQKMLTDVESRVKTVDFSFNNIVQRSDGAYTAYGKHVFYDVNGEQKTVYVSYTIKDINGRWTMVAAGTSSSPLG